MGVEGVQVYISFYHILYEGGAYLLKAYCHTGYHVGLTLYKTNIVYILVILFKGSQVKCLSTVPGVI